MPARARRSGDQRVIRDPSNVTFPERGVKSPITVLSSVVLPTPFLPMRQTTVPRGTSRSTPHRIWLPPYATSSFSIDSMGLGLPSPTDVHLQHPGILLDLFVRPLAEDGALMEHGDFAGDPADELHVMLDHEHRAGRRDLHKQVTGSRGLLVRHPRDRLVDQQEFRVLSHDHPDLEPLLLAV